MILNLFLSSRNKDLLTLNHTLTTISLTDIRQHIRDELQKVKFMDRDFIYVEINESFADNASRDSYLACIDKIKKADLFICLYNGASGWAPPGFQLGICHAELEAALAISSRKTYYIDIRKYFIPIAENDDEAKRNTVFSKFVDQMDAFNNPLKPLEETVEGVKDAFVDSVKRIVYNHLEDRIQISNQYYNIAGNNKIALDWKKLKYSDRAEQSRKILVSLLTSTENFKILNCPAAAVPDNLSVADARAYCGRPFLRDQDLVTVAAGDPVRCGPIHFIAVYGAATPLQVKSLVGYPDITAIKDGFGVYAWEQNSHIQLVFLTDCATPAGLEAKFLLFTKWCNANGEYANMVKRARARHLIVSAFNEAKTITGS